MNVRRIIYFSILALAIFLIFQGLPLSQEQVLLPPGNLSREEVLRQFENGFPELTGEEETVKAVIFPLNYKGGPGDSFYIETEYNGEPVTIWYVIQDPNSDGETLQYSEKNRWEGLQLPEEKFDRYLLEGEEWAPAPK